MSAESFEYLDLDDLLLLATGLFGDPPPIRDLGLLGGAADRPRTSVFGRDAYPDVWAKAAALLHSIVKHHPLVDGNKRLGWLACAVFLELNGVDPTVASNEAVVALVEGLAGSSPEVAEIAAQLRKAVAKTT